MMQQIEDYQKPVIDCIKSLWQNRRGQNPRPRFVPGDTPGDLGALVMEDTWEQCETIGTQGTGRGQFEGARGIAAADPDIIAVTDRRNKRLLIYDRREKSWQTIDPVKANEVAATPDRWIVSEPRVIKVYNRNDLAFIGDFPTVQPEVETQVKLFGVAIKGNGNILVGDCEGKVVTEITHDGMHEVSRIPVKIKPHFLAVIGNAWIAVSDWKEAVVHIVGGSDGHIVTTIRPRINDQPVHSCRGVCSDGLSVYIAASTVRLASGHIHQYDLRGRFITCVAKNLHDPYGITFTVGGHQLAVADLHDVKIYRKK
ncbi:uncharacterized protein LOC110976824 [Acanthaster planci]|uniref:Uncharacterized protein LOC110976824 n=1 Tax=Acanthaster planci TaxID=133434 RepID=A0A8B7XYZ5_ACAPL|nr:uncharacterized protein LOC110976824 [Acanthaster planci]